MQQVTVFAIVQGGRLQFEALLMMASLARTNPGLRVVLGEPQPGPLWPRDPRIADPAFRDELQRLGAEIRPFESRFFGAAYPHGNKIEGLACLTPGRPFVFFDTDTVFPGSLAEVPFDFDRPTASLNREDTWPKLRPGGPGREAIWRALYDRFGLDLDTAIDPVRDADDWERFPYYNAGWFFHRCPAEFGAAFLEIARGIRDDPPPELAGQSLDPWLDQVALPLVIHRLGGGPGTLPPGLLDGRVSCHWRTLPLLYAREPAEVIAHVEQVAAPNRIKRLLKRHEPARVLIYQGKGKRVRKLFADAPLPPSEAPIRKRIKAAGLWLR